MATNGDIVEGYLVVKVLEVAGHNKNDEPVWDPSFQAGYVKVEIRGGSRIVKKTTSLQKVVDNVITWEEQLALEALKDANELRIMLCQEKKSDERPARSSVVAACGIYIRDLLEAVPVDKYFELFQPKLGKDGGFIRVSVNYLLPDQVRNGAPPLEAEPTELSEPAKKEKGRAPWVQLALLAAAAALAATRVLAKKN
ncbi:hypothetical protein ACKKBG_A13965 [Auxenochlorella protothecoides x Auxenochlorella symbiontica]